jgi:hypothetical protein
MYAYYLGLTLGLDREAREDETLYFSHQWGPVGATPLQSFDP